MQYVYAMTFYVAVDGWSWPWPSEFTGDQLCKFGAGQIKTKGAREDILDIMHAKRLYNRWKAILCTRHYLFIHSFIHSFIHLLCRRPIGWGIMQWCPLSVYVCLSVPSLTPSRERKVKLKIGRMEAHDTMVTRDPVQRSKGQRSWSLGRLTPWPKISHIFGTGRTTNFKLGIRIEYSDPHHRYASDFKGQRSRL